MVPGRALILGGFLVLLTVVGAALVSMDVRPRESGSPAQLRQLQKVSALGRLEPRNGIIRVAGPPRAAVVIKELTVAEGDWVARGQTIAVLLGIAVQRAEVARLELRSFELAKNVARRAAASGGRA